MFSGRHRKDVPSRRLDEHSFNKDNERGVVEQTRRVHRLKES
jgi:hypothetical protein